MKLQHSMKFNALAKLAKTSAAVSLLILAGCGATLPLKAPVAATSPAQPNKAAPRPLGCSEFDPVTYSNGKPDPTVKDVQDALASTDNPLGKARNVLGDTVTTKGQIDVYMRERQALCGK